MKKRTGAPKCIHVYTFRGLKGTAPGGLGGPKKRTGAPKCTHVYRIEAVAGHLTGRGPKAEKAHRCAKMHTCIYIPGTEGAEGRRASTDRKSAPVRQNAHMYIHSGGLRASGRNRSRGIELRVWGGNRRVLGPPDPLIKKGPLRFFAHPPPPRAGMRFDRPPR
jgi:hypothetical protein